MSDIAISIKNVSKYYKLYNSPQDRLKEALSISNKVFHKKFYATKNLDLTIKKGEVVGIVGKNGSGKSTLLKLITGVLTPDEGSIKVTGKISALLELGSGFNPEFTGIQNIFFYGTILGFTKKQMEEKLDDIIAFADIGDFLYQPLKTYSSGMRSRLGFAVAVHIDPEILILDEVLSVGDVLFKRKCYAKMEEFFKGGKTILYVSHDANSITELCSRAIFLNEGNILLDSDPKTVTKYYQKYIFANAEEKLKLKNKLTNQSMSNNTALKEKNSNSNTISTKKENTRKQQDKAYMIPNFTSTTKLIYDASKMDIFDISITTLTNEKVNTLIHGEKYIYHYKLKFHETCKNVAFGMTVKTEKGFQITTAGSLNFNITIESAYKGDIYEITWEFTCFLTTGVYFTNAGATYIINNQREILNRVIDAYTFKVLPLPNKISGIVSLMQTPQYKKLRS